MQANSRALRRSDDGGASATALFQAKRSALRRAYPTDTMAPAAASASAAPAVASDIDDGSGAANSRLRRLSSAMKY